MNRAIIHGNLGADPELRTTQNGNPVCNLRVAVNERVKRGDEWVEHTEWFRVVVFGRKAEVVAEHRRKGGAVIVEGRMRSRKWTDKDGAQRVSFEILADDVHFAGRGGGGGGRREQAYRDVPDDDIPF